MDVIHVSAPVAFVLDQVFPETFLPDLSGLALVGGGEAFLDRLDAVGEVIVSIGKALDAVQVVGQDHGGIDLERSILAQIAKCGP